MKINKRFFILSNDCKVLYNIITYGVDKINRFVSQKADLFACCSFHKQFSSTSSEPYNIFSMNRNHNLVNLYQIRYPLKQAYTQKIAHLSKNLTIGAKIPLNRRLPH